MGRNDVDVCCGGNGLLAEEREGFHETCVRRHTCNRPHTRLCFDNSPVRDKLLSVWHRIVNARHNEIRTLHVRVPSLDIPSNPCGKLPALSGGCSGSSVR